ncbi:hypothetical protein [Saccharothrix deserti]|nr:hypothetical protein [Saccharothrix deserti]
MSGSPASLTPLGSRFTATLSGVLGWIGEHVPEVLDAQRRYDES